MVAKQLSIEEGKSVGDKEYAEVVDAARARLGPMAMSFQKEADTKEAQGSIEGYVRQSQSSIARTLFEPFRQIWGCPLG